MLYRSILASAALFLVALTLSGCRDSWQNAPTGAPATAPTTDTAPATSTAPTTDTAPATTAPSK